MGGGSNTHAARGEWTAGLAAALVAGALVLGGGGIDNPVTEILLQGLAAALAVAWLWSAGPVRATTREHHALWLIAALALAVPAVQLMPLPPAIWTALPGREPEAAALTLIGEQGSWRPLSLSPPRTLAALLALGPPLLAMLMAASLDDKGRARLVAVVAVVALAAAVLGAAQWVGGPGALRLYADSHPDWPVGFHNNRNHAADLLLIGSVALSAALATAAIEPKRKLAGWAIGGAVLLLAAVMTGSRAGIALIPVALLGQWLILRRTLPAGPWRSLPVAAAGVVTVLALAAVLLRDNPALGAVAQRFTLTGDMRIEYWRDAAFAAGQYWPLGAGLGAFVPVMLAAERLQAVSPGYPNRAHNDYLELAVEAGLPGLVVLAAIGLLVAWLAWRKWRATPQAAQLWFALAALAILGLHSAVDYPLRTLALATVAALAVGLLTPPPQRSEAP